MKVYCPTQFNWKRGEEVVGWIDDCSGDIYICGLSKNLEFDKQFEVSNLCYELESLFLERWNYKATSTW